MIDTAIGGMKTRFINKGKNPTLLILASSKRSEKSFLEEHMRKKLQSEKENVLIVDEPVWNVRPPSEYSGKKFNLALGNKFLMSQVLEDDDDVNIWINRGYKILHIPIEFRANFLDDIDRALCDFAGISSSEISKYISGAAVNEIKNNERSNPFVKDIIEVGNAPDDTAQYYDFFDMEKINKELLNKPLYIHLDMSISGDMTGIAGVWISGKKTSVSELNQSKDLFYTLAFSVSIKAPKGRQISFEKNRNFIYWLKDRGFKIKSISTDTFQSCLPQGTLIQTTRGPVPIENVTLGQEVLTYNQSSHFIEPKPVLYAGETDQVEELYEIELVDGNIVQCTGNHLLLTERGYVRADCLLETDCVICAEFPSWRPNCNEFERGV